MQKELKRKRTEYLLSFVDEFKQSDEPKTVYDCYDYVKTSAYQSIETFIETLTAEESKIFEKRIDIWLTAVESITTFQMFLNNYNIKL
jgi:hypothetical protein